MLISVLIPAYNAEKYLSRCLRSLHHQSLPQTEYEVILVNDGSDDRTSFIAAQFAGWIEYIELPENRGLPFALNHALRAAQGKFVVRVDADDYVNTHFLLFLTQALLTNPNHDAVCCDYLRVDDMENEFARKNAVEEPIGCGIIFDKDDLKSLGGYNHEFKINEEKELIRRFTQSGKTLMRLPLPLYRYRNVEDSLSKSRLKSNYDELLRSK